mgnify:CR=1 FL=1
MSDKLSKEPFLPKLTFEMPGQSASQIKLRVWCDLIPPELFCKINVEKIGGTEEENAALTKLVQYTAKGSGAFGRINGGICEAFLSKRGLKKGDVLSLNAVVVDNVGTEIEELFGKKEFSDHLELLLE